MRVSHLQEWAVCDLDAFHAKGRISKAIFKVYWGKLYAIQDLTNNVGWLQISWNIPYFRNCNYNGEEFQKSSYLKHPPILPGLSSHPMNTLLSGVSWSYKSVCEFAWASANPIKQYFLCSKFDQVKAFQKWSYCQREYQLVSDIALRWIFANPQGRRIGNETRLKGRNRSPDVTSVLFFP